MQAITFWVAQAFLPVWILKRLCLPASCKRFTLENPDSGQGSAQNRKIGQANPLPSAYTLAWRNYDPLETRRAAGCYELADSLRRLIYTVPVEAVERSAFRYDDGPGCSFDGRGVAPSLFSKPVCVD